MPRPKSANAAATKGRILSAAGDAFAIEGRTGASIRQIAAAADVSLAMIHHYFGSKDGLYEACIESMYAELAPLRRSLLNQVLSGAALEVLIPQAVRTGFRFARSHQQASRLLFRQLTVSGQLEPKLIEREQRPFLDATTAALGSATGRPAISFRLPLQSAVVLVARYGISSQTELATFAGVDSSTDIELTVEDHLVHAVLALLGIPMETQ